MSKLFASLIVFLFSLNVFAQAQVPTEPDQKNAYRLAKLFYAARAAIGEKAQFTDDPTSDKIQKSDLIAGIRKSYEWMAGEPLQENSSAEVALLWQAIDNVVEKARKGAYKGYWSDHPNFPGKLIPARFGNLITQEFNSLASTRGSLKWTTSPEYLVNPASKADDWELKAITEKFKSSDWRQGDAHFELVQLNNKKSYRYALPEYFKSACLNCHGGDMGKKIHQGKSAAGTGSFGGVLSVKLAK